MLLKPGHNKTESNGAYELITCELPQPGGNQLDKQLNLKIKDEYERYLSGKKNVHKNSDVTNLL